MNVLAILASDDPVFSKALLIDRQNGRQALSRDQKIAKVGRMLERLSAAVNRDGMECIPHHMIVIATRMRLIAPKALDRLEDWLTEEGRTQFINANAKHGSDAQSVQWAMKKRVSAIIMMESRS